MSIPEWGESGKSQDFPGCWEPRWPQKVDWTLTEKATRDGGVVQASHVTWNKVRLILYSEVEDLRASSEQIL